MDRNGSGASLYPGLLGVVAGGRGKREDVLLTMKREEEGNSDLLGGLKFTGCCFYSVIRKGCTTAPVLDMPLSAGGPQAIEFVFNAVLKA